MQSVGTREQKIYQEKPKLDDYISFHISIDDSQTLVCSLQKVTQCVTCNETKQSIEMTILLDKSSYLPLILVTLKRTIKKSFIK